jgi:hypothetical protein
MTRTITILIQNEAGERVPPPLDYTFGISLSNDIFPTLYQDSNRFIVEKAGTYYVFFKKSGFTQDANNVLSFLIDDDAPIISTPPVVLSTPPNLGEIRPQLLRSPINVVRDGQNKFNVPQQSLVAQTTLLINAERYYENISFSLNADRSQIIWYDTFKIDTNDVVAVEYFTTL